MTQRLNEEYLSWIQHRLCKSKRFNVSCYNNLFRVLYDIIFVPYNDMDCNRISDASNLRLMFSTEVAKCSHVLLATSIGHAPSVLEVLIAMSMRLHEAITQGLPEPITASQIFWTMMDNLGLVFQTDANFDQYGVRDTVMRMMYHDIYSNGAGGAFIIQNPEHDMREADLWYQAQWWITEQYNDQVNYIAKHPNE